MQTVLDHDKLEDMEELHDHSQQKLEEHQANAQAVSTHSHHLPLSTYRYQDNWKQPKTQP